MPRGGIIGHRGSENERLPDTREYYEPGSLRWKRAMQELAADFKAMEQRYAHWLKTGEHRRE